MAKVAAVTDAAGSVSSQSAASQSSGSSWARDMCLGCGHVTTPPHRRAQCPHKSVSGWLATGVPRAPLRLPSRSTVSAITHNCEKISVISGSIGPLNVEVGLDTMSCMSLISPQVFQSLLQDGGISRPLAEPVVVHTAGTAEPSVVDTEIDITVKLSNSVLLNLTCGVFAIPTDVIISWGDIVKHQLVQLLAELAGVSLPCLTELASEESDEGAGSFPVANSEVPGEAVECLQSLLSEFSESFSENLPAVSAKLPAMQLELVDPKVMPGSVPPRRQSVAVQEIIRDNVEDLLQQGHIVPSQSQVASGVVVIRLPGKVPRMCIDYRDVNLRTVSTRYPLPSLKGILSRLQGQKYFCKLDLRKGYHQLAMDSASRYFTAFVCEQGQFEFCRVPFGLKNAPAFFQSIINTHVLVGLLSVICEAYMDDVVVVGDSLESLTNNVRLVLQRFQHFGLVVHPRKVVFGVTELEFLGHLVSSDGLRLAESKLQGLRELQPPSDKLSLKSFLGLANYFRDFVPNYSSRLFNLMALASPKVPFVWSDIQEDEFQDVRGAILSAPMLYHIDYSLPIILRTDASMRGVGAVLVQIKNGRERPICFLSKKLSPAASRWSTIDQEAFAIFYAITSLSHYLRGHKFLVETDHNNLVYIAKSQDGRVARWRLALQEYDFIVSHIPGSTNVIADALSRCCAISKFNSNCVLPVASELSPELEAGVSVQVVEVEQGEIIARFHNDVCGHHGIRATIKSLLSAGHSWVTLRTDVVKFIHACAICQKSRVTEQDNSVAEPHVIEAYEPFQEISLDSVVNLPEDNDNNSVILVVIDNFTRFVELFAVPDVSAVTAAKCLLSVVGRYGPIEIVRSDRGGQFVGDIFHHLVNFMGSRQLLTIGYRPQANGVVERANAEIVRHLSAMVHSRRIKGMWSFGLPMVQRILNACVHSSTGFAPARLLFGERISLDRAILTPFPVKSDLCIPAFVQKMHRYQNEALVASQQHLAEIMDRRCQVQGEIRHFGLGDYVLVNSNVFAAESNKFAFKWRGPFLVQAVQGNTYSCLDLRTRAIHFFDVASLRHFDSSSSEDPVAIAALDVDEDVVSQIVSHQVGTKGKESHKFDVMFADGSIHQLAYLDVRNLEALDKYLAANPVAKAELKL